MYIFNRLWAQYRKPTKLQDVNTERSGPYCQIRRAKLFIVEVWMLALARATQPSQDCKWRRNYPCRGKITFHIGQNVYLSTDINSFSSYYQIIAENGDVTNSDAISDWMKRDILARNYLIATIENQQQRVLINCNTAHEMWVRLSAQHLRNAVENQHVLQQKFFEYQFQPENDILSHITEIETMASQLHDVGAPVTAIQIMTKIICTLPPSYRSFTTAWDSVPAAEKTIALLTSRLLKEETMAKRWSRGQPDASDATFFAHNFPSFNPSPAPNSTQPTSRGRGRGRVGRGSRRCNSNNRNQPYKFCTYHRCNIAGHTIEVCRKRFRDEQEAKKDQNFVANAASTEVKAQKEAHPKEDGAFISSSCFIGRSSQDWFADSGATQHMTDQRSYFNHFTPIMSGTWTVNGIGATQLIVCGYGDIDFIVTIGGI